MKQIKVVEIYEKGVSNVMILDNSQESWLYIQYLYNTGRRIQINLVKI